MLRGMIIVWYGAIEDIPDGWALCDGNNGTPDLRNRSIIGPGSRYIVDEIGGTRFQTHNFTGDGHQHQDVGGAPPNILSPGSTRLIDQRFVTGTTDQADNYHPFYTLAHIMKLYDDPDPRDDLPWPYAAKAIIEHSHVAPDLLIYITFRFKMNTDNKPADGLWLCELDGVPDAVDSSVWLDQWTMQLTIEGVAGPPTVLTVEYDGPSPLLATIWDKQWEPWGPIISIGEEGVPFGSFKGNEIDWTQAAAQDTWYTISDADISVGQEFLCTFQNNQEIKVSLAGIYSLDYYASVECSIAGKHVLTAPEINGTEQNDGQTHHEFGRANEEESWSASALLSLAANDVVSIGIATSDAGNPTLTVNHIGMTLTRVDP